MRDIHIHRNSYNGYAPSCSGKNSSLQVCKSAGLFCLNKDLIFSNPILTSAKFRHCQQLGPGSLETACDFLRIRTKLATSYPVTTESCECSLPKLLSHIQNPVYHQSSSKVINLDLLSNKPFTCTVESS